MQIATSTNAINRNLVRISKQSVILIGIKDQDVAIVSMSKKGHVPYVFHGSSSDEAYQKFLHLIGKMILKSEDSKYFGNPIEAEDCVNGHPCDLPKTYWKDLTVEFINEYLEEFINDGI